MQTRKNTLLLFSKLPEPGLVKTRLTKLKDGAFTPEVASALYHCMLFDVVEICCAALAKCETFNFAKAAPEAVTGEDTSAKYIDEYELVISTAPAENVSKMRSLFLDAGDWPREIKFIADAGASFDEHYNHAFDQVWAGGSDCILSMGADMPALTVADVVGGFDALHMLMDAPEYAREGIVLAPDQEMGVSVVGWSRNAEFDHSGVYYNQSGLTVLPAYIQKAKAAGMPAVYLPPIPDVDTMADLMHNITLVEALNYCAAFDGNTPPWRTAQALSEMGITQVRVAPNDLRDPREHLDN